MKKLLIGVGAVLGVLVLAVAGLLWYAASNVTIEGPFTNVLFGSVKENALTETELRERAELPQGVEIGVYAGELGNIRRIAFTPAGDLLVSDPRAGKIRLLERDGDGDGRADGRRVVLDGLDDPHGLDFRDGWLYVAESTAVRRVRFDAEAGEIRGEPVKLGEIPGGGMHWTRSLALGPDGMIYVTVGSSCNICVLEDERRAAMLRLPVDGGEPEIYARGLRNTVGFDWRPETGELYGVDNGADLLGDDFPPDELNRIEPGGFYGWPYRHGFGVPDPDYGDQGGQRARKAREPVFAFGAHVAPLAIHFLEGENLPDPYDGAALVAQHGSWNRSELAGYRVVSLHWGEDGRITERAFVTGLLRDGEVLGRPVDITRGPDGAVYISDDYAGAVYRVTFDGDAKPGPVLDPPLAAAPHGEPAADPRRQ